MIFKNNGLCLILLWAVSYGFTVCASANNPSQQQVSNKIETLSTDLKLDEKKTTKLKNEVKALEKKLGEITRKEYATEKKTDQIEQKLKRFAIKRKQLDEILNRQKKGLAQQLQASYSAGEQSHLRLLLRQDNPSSIGRTVKYFEYLNKSRLSKIARVKKTLSEINTIEREGQNDKKKLQGLIEKLSIQKKASQRVLNKREVIYKQTKKSVLSKDKQLKQLKRKEAGLQAKINGLVAKSDEKSIKARQKPTAKTASNTAKNRELTVADTRSYRSNKPFSQLRGKLSWPVKGKVLHRYGTQRNKKQRWKGTVISASGGRKVKAIAAGEIEFAGWFNGYGYLIIIRHDKYYRSLYGYNRAVHVNVGDRVKAGKTIASVGNSGGQQQNALYFEIRKQAQPNNPAKWCR